MSKRRMTENPEILQENLITEKWPNVLVDNIDAKHKDLFLTRKTAIDLYLNDEKSLEEIEVITGVNRKEINRLFKRCLSVDGNGNIWGYIALIPNKNIKPYERNLSPNINILQSKNKTGLFTQLLETYPFIKEIIDNLFLGQNKNSVNETMVKPKVIHKKFIDACRSAGIKLNEYPFNTKGLGKRALERYLKKLASKNFSKVAKMYGEAAKRQAQLNTSFGRQSLIIRPYERVQFDGHRIDALIALSFTTPEGDEIIEVMERIWLLVIMDVATRSILGYHLSLNKEYSSSDVLQCIKKAIVPWVKMNLTIPDLKYPDQGGFLSIKIPETEWALWDEFCYDNAKANLSTIVLDRLTQIVGCSINAGPIKCPEKRSLIERFFGILEENGYHRLPSTTGSHPQDPRRSNPETKAVKYRISAEHLEEITEILIANYNGCPHGSINYLSPLEVMQQRISRGIPIRQMPIEKRNETQFLSYIVKRTVVGGIHDGRRPHINFEGAKYSNDVLSKMPNLIGEKLDLLINITDIRTIKAFLSDGSELGILVASGKWGITPHTLQIRRQINKLRYRKLIYYTSTDDPIEIYKRYLQGESKSKKRARNQLGELNRIQYEQFKDNSIEKNRDIENIPNIPSKRKETIREENHNKNNNILDKQGFKTIIY